MYSPHPEVLKILGMQPSTSDQSSSLPGIRIQRSLTVEAESSGIDMNNPVVSTLYEGLLYVEMAPDHLLTCIGKNFLSLCFQKLVAEETICAVYIIVFRATAMKVISVGKY